MTPLYSLYVNAQFVVNWTSLDRACECTETAIHAFALARVAASLTLERTYLQTSSTPAVPEAIPQVGFTVRTLIACNIAVGSWDMAICRVRYNECHFEETDLETV